MGFLSGLLRRAGLRAATSYPGRPPSDGSIAGWFGAVDSTAGVVVTEWTALNLSAVWAAVNIISGALAQLPLILYRRRGQAKERATDHPVYGLLRNPSPDAIPFSWKQALTAHCLLWGNAYAEIERDGAGAPIALNPMTPNQVKPDRIDGRLVYRLTNPASKGEVLPAEDVLHVSGPGFDGVCGYSVVGFARESLGLTSATERFGASWFGNGSRPGGVLTHPGQLKPKAKEDLRESWERLHQGPGSSHRVAVLDMGLQWQQIGIPPEDAQFLGTREFQTVEVARWFNIPPHLLRDLSRATFSNIEHQSLEFVTYTLGPWMCRFEQEFTRKLLPEDEQEEYFAEHLADALLRGDTAGRYAVYQIARQNGLMNADEIRAKENMNPIPDGSGQEYLINGNMVPVSRIIEQPEPPPAPAPEPPPAPDRTQKAALIAAHRALVVDAVGRMCRRITQSARRLANDPKNFCPGLDGLRAQHEDVIGRALAPVLLALESLTRPPAYPSQVAGSLLTEAREVLLELAGEATAQDLAAKVGAWCDRWEVERPASIADWLLREEIHA